MTTPQHLAERLGLQDFDTFALEARWRLANHRFKYRDSPVPLSLSEVNHRQQGHSTRNILAALCRLIDTDAREVVIVAHTKAMGDLLVRQAGDWALELGLDPRRIKGATARSGYEVGRYPEDVFVDHVVREFPEAC